MILIVGIQELKELMMGLDLRINKITQATDGEKSVVKYREKHPHCRYCIHGRRGSVYDDIYCIARRKSYIFNRARYCNLYEVDTEMQQRCLCQKDYIMMTSSSKLQIEI